MGYHYFANIGASYSLVGSTLTFTTAVPEWYQVGDYLIGECTQLDAPSTQWIPTFAVTNISGGNITATAFIDTARIAGAPPYSLICVQEWAPAIALTGTTTSGSPTITSVSPTTIIRIGDWIKGTTGIPTMAHGLLVSAVQLSHSTKTPRLMAQPPCILVVCTLSQLRRPSNMKYLLYILALWLAMCGTRRLNNF